jgi:arylsulfatase A-like enzyme
VFRSHFIFLTVLAVILCGCRAQKGKNPVLSFNQIRTNVIVIITDDQGYGDMSCHGNPYLETPGIDALHAESVRLTNFHVDPTCSPTRAALNTGRYSSRVGVWLTYGGRNHLRKDEVTLADVFKNNGYKTAMFGKWHLGDNYPFRPQDRGFDESLIHGGGVVGETPDYWNNDYYDDSYFHNGVPEKMEGYCTDVWFREAGNWIEKNKDEPFFTYIATNAPHGPLHALIEYIQPYLDAGIPESRARFYGMIRVIDENIARLRSRLEEMEIADDTMIVFLTDNGTANGFEISKGRDGSLVSGFNAGMRGKKGSAYDGGHRAAGFIHWPNGKLVQGQDIPNLTAQIDIMPTLVELCNLNLPHRVKFDGTSLADLVRGESNAVRERTLFVHHQGRFGGFVGDAPLIKDKDFSVMTQQWRLVGNELFDMETDPGQLEDVATDHPKVVEQLQEAYEDWWSDISQGSDAYVPFVIDTSKQQEYTFSSQNWHGDAVPYNQQHVRSGMKANGFWVIDVVEAGSYEIEIRRWPKEADAAFNEKVQLGPYTADTHETNNSMLQAPTKAFSIKSVRLSVAGFEQTVPLSRGSKSVSSSTYIPKGEHKLQAWMIDESGEEQGAYYVYLRKI